VATVHRRQLQDLGVRDLRPEPDLHQSVERHLGVGDHSFTFIEVSHLATEIPSMYFFHFTMHFWFKYTCMYLVFKYQIVTMSGANDINKQTEASAATRSPTYDF
jgi:hypothetical protein